MIEQIGPLIGPPTYWVAIKTHNKCYSTCYIYSVYPIGLVVVVVLEVVVVVAVVAIFSFGHIFLPKTST